jgi:GNAT superfamily N-acetyltransferase
MPYSQIDISEVGPPEYPLIAVLRDTIFGEFGHRYAARFEDQVQDRRDVLALIAHLEGNPVGYKIGYHDKPGLYYSWSGGVLKDYRSQGVARRMQDWQHTWLRARGYRMVHFSSFNKFRPMLLFGLDTGFIPTGVDLSPEGELSIRFRKDLTLPDRPRNGKLPPTTNAMSDRDHRVNVPHNDVALIRQYLALNFNIIGMIHDDTATQVMLERPLSR